MAVPIDYAHLVLILFWVSITVFIFSLLKTLFDYIDFIGSTVNGLFQLLLLCFSVACGTDNHLYGISTLTSVMLILLHFLLISLSFFYLSLNHCHLGLDLDLDVL